MAPSAALSPGENPGIQLNERLGGTPEPVWAFRGRDKSLAPTRIRTTARSARSLVSVRSEISWTPKCVKIPKSN